MTHIFIMQSLCQVWKPEWQGMVMAELSYRRGQAAVSPSYRVTVKEGRLVRISALDDATGEEMGMVLLPQKKGKAGEKTGPTGEPWRSFSADEVRNFSRSLGDHNAIHQGVCPIVSGFQLFSSLQEVDRFPSAKLRFYASIKAGEVVYLKRESQGWTGYTDTRCFSYEEKK